MKGMMLGLVLAVFGVAGVAGAQAPAGAPAGSTGVCKDGTYSTQASKQGACRGHKGIQTWFVADSAATGGTSAGKSSPAATAVPKPSASTAASGPAPAGSTGRCKDGTYTTQTSKQGACRGHQGIDTWMGGDAGAPANAGMKSTPAMTPSPTTATPASKPAAAAAAPSPSPAAPASANAGKKMGPAAAAAAKPQATGGGPGLVWVNTESKVYHCMGDAFYGKTKQGSYMTEAEAKAAGARGDRGKSCAGK